VNKYELVGVAGQKGVYTLSQLSIHVKQLNLLQNLASPNPSYTVSTEPPVILLNKGEGQLFAGRENKMSLSVYCGSESLDTPTDVELTCSMGVTVRDPSQVDAPFSRTLTITIPAGGPSFHTVTVDLLVLAQLENKRDASTIEATITLTNPWTGETQDIALHFVPVVYSTFSLLTAMSKKFVQLTVSCLAPRNYVLKNGQLRLLNAAEELPSGLSLKPVNSATQTLVVSKQFEGSFLWELDVGEESGGDGPVKLEFSFVYSPEDASDEERAFSACYQFQHYRTLYTIYAKVEPAKGNEFCRASTLCPMKIELEQLSPAPHTSLFYEVLADQTQWAVCGRQGAVINLQQSLRQNIIVDVMPLTGGHLPLPTVRLSKYIPAEGRSGALGGARLDPFSVGQVYNMSRAQQIHVLPPANQTQEFVSLP